MEEEHQTWCSVTVILEVPLGLSLVDEPKMAMVTPSEEQWKHPAPSEEQWEQPAHSKEPWEQKE